MLKGLERLFRGGEIKKRLGEREGGIFQRHLNDIKAYLLNTDRNIGTVEINLPSFLIKAK